jgi:quinol monooxygenase YgiN
MKSTIVKFTTKPEHKTRLQQRLKKHKQQPKEAGNKEKVFVSKAEDNVFFVYERWADIAAITSHDNESHTKS